MPLLVGDAEGCCCIWIRWLWICCKLAIDWNAAGLMFTWGSCVRPIMLVSKSWMLLSRLGSCCCAWSSFYCRRRGGTKPPFAETGVFWPD